MELGAAGGYRQRGGLVMAAITRVFTLEAAAHILGEDIDFLGEILIDMEPEDGRLTIWGVGEDHTPGFTDFGLESLQDFIREHRANEKRADEKGKARHRTLTAISAPSLMSVRRVRPRQTTALPGGGSAALARYPPSRASFVR